MTAIRRALESLNETILGLPRNGGLPPTLHFRTPNPAIPLDRLPLVIQDHYAPWPEHDGPALAGVSSFGFGGTNAHVVLEGPPPRAPRGARPCARRSAHLPWAPAHDAPAR